ncbi:unnamed protein product, partial [Brachionus calyciflorus]
IVFLEMLQTKRNRFSTYFYQEATFNGKQMAPPPIQDSRYKL